MWWATIQQVGLSALGSLTASWNCKRYYPRGTKTALGGSVREDRQVETDDGVCTIVLVPCYTCSCTEPRVATSGRAYLEAEGWGLGGQREETKGGLSEQTKQRLAGYRQAKRQEDPGHGFCYCFVPVSPSEWHLPGKRMAFISVFTVGGWLVFTVTESADVWDTSLNGWCNS